VLTVKHNEEGVSSLNNSGREKRCLDYLLLINDIARFCLLHFWWEEIMVVRTSVMGRFTSVIFLKKTSTQKLILKETLPFRSFLFQTLTFKME